MFRDLRDHISDTMSEISNEMPWMSLGIVTALAMFFGAAYVYLFGLQATIVFLAVILAAALTHRGRSLIHCIILGLLLKLLIGPMSILLGIWFGLGEAVYATIKFIEQENLLILVGVTYLFGYIVEILLSALISVLRAFRPFGR
jgi:hypothetical protein